MLRLTKRLMLAIEAVVDIAYNASELPVQSSDIAQRQDISKRYLEPVLQQLVHADILTGVRGPHGGYRLSRSRRRISLGEITRVVAKMEGRTDPLDEAARSDLGQAVLRPLWQELNDTAIRRLESISTDEICRRARSADVEPSEAPQFDFMR